MPRLLIAYAGLLALLDLVVLLPGDSASFSSGSGLVGAVFIQSLLVWRLARRSWFAWVICLLIALWTVAAIVLMATPFDGAVVLITVLAVAQAVVLVTPPVRGFVRGTPPAAA